MLFVARRQRQDDVSIQPRDVYMILYELKYVTLWRKLMTLDDILSRQKIYNTPGSVSVVQIGFVVKTGRTTDDIDGAATFNSSYTTRTIKA